MPCSVFSLTGTPFLAAFAAALLAVPAPARVKMAGGALADGGGPLVIRAVAYPGARSGEPPEPARIFGSCQYARDLPLIAAMGANTVRTEELSGESEAAFLSLLETTGLYWLAGFSITPYHDPARPLGAVRGRIIEDFRRYASRFRGRQKLIGYVFGDEVTEDYSRKFTGSPSDFFALLEDAAAVLAELEPEDPPLLATAVRNIGDIERQAPGVSFWLLNIGGSAAEVRIPGRSLGRVEAGFGDLFEPAAATQGSPGGVRPRATASALAGKWGGTAPSRTAKPPLASRFDHAASGAPFASPGALIRLHGEFLHGGADRSFAAWPLAADTTSLCLGGIPAPLGFVSSGMITAQVPWEMAPGDHPAIVFSGGLAANAVATQIERYAPGVFAGAVVRAGTACVVSAAGGVRPGEYLEVFGTGFGGGTLDDTRLEAFVNNTPAAVLYLGLVPGFTGLNQINVRVDPATPPSRQTTLDLRMEGASSNPYPLSVAGPADRPGIALGSPGGEILLQAGGDAATVPVRVEGTNGYCGPVLFQAERLPEGVSFRTAVGFTGQTAQIEIRAASGAPAVDGGSLVLIGHASGATGGSVTVRLSILPNRGNIPIRVVSGGFKSAPLARFDWNGRTLYSTAGGGPGRGINVLAVDPRSGRLGPVRSFDTWGDDTASGRLAAYLSGLAEETIVLFAVADDGSLLLSGETREAIATMFGSRFIRSLGYQESWAMIGRKGATPVSEHLSTDSQVMLERVLSFSVP